MAQGQIKISANLVHRELRNAAFEVKRCQPQLHCRTHHSLGDGTVGDPVPPVDRDVAGPGDGRGRLEAIV